MTEETIFWTALQQPTPAQRAIILDAACNGDSKLRQRIEALLDSHAQSHSIIDKPAVVRLAKATDEPVRSTDLPNGDVKPVTPERREPDPPTRDDLLRLLATAGELGSLGRLDHYEMLEEVGRGAMGVVFKARDTKLQKIVAIKVLAPHLAADAKALVRFIREAQSAAAVRDDHVVDIYAVSDEGPVPYLVMEFIGGVTLEQRIKQRLEQRAPMEVTEILRIGMQTAQGLAAAHSQGLIHRDLKPANILLENGVQRVKIVDFGLARAVDDVKLTQSGRIAGTPLYMSPEQARGENTELDHRSDLFSLGSVLYILCTGQPAFSARNTYAVIKQVCEDTPRPIREINPAIPDRLAAVVGKLHAKDPQERFQSAAEVAEEVAELLREHQARPRPPEMGKVPSPAVQTASQGPAARIRKRVKPAAALLGLAGVVASLMIVVLLPWERLFLPSDVLPPVGSPIPPPADDPRVLTVSQKNEGGGRYRTIKEALDEVQPEMTIRVLDDAVYDEYLLINRPEQHRGVVLEAAGRASIRMQPGETEAVMIRGVPGFTLRNFSFKSPPRHQGPPDWVYAQVCVRGSCPGIVLDRLIMTAKEGNCIDLYENADGTNGAPIVIQNCTMQEGRHAVIIGGRDRSNFDRPRPCGHVVIRNNTIVRCEMPVLLLGEIHAIQIVGNHILDSRFVAIGLIDVLPGAADILVANNTLLRNDEALRIWDDHSKGKAFHECKSIRFQNNLLLNPQHEADLFFQDDSRGKPDQPRAGELGELLHSPEWRFSHNWREIDSARAAHRFSKIWIPACPNDHLQIPIKVLSRNPGDPNFLRPPKDSPLATAGAGVSDPSLPAYIGAVPPDGVQPWDWQKTWDIQCRRLLTVSKDPAAGGHFRTIKDALENVKPEMTIRVLDDAVYEEDIRIDRREQHRGVVLEAVGKATIRKLPGESHSVWIRGVSGFTLRNFSFESAPRNYAHVYISGSCPGVVLDHLDIAAKDDGVCVHIHDVRLSGMEAHIVIQNCTMRNGRHAILLEGRNRKNINLQVLTGHVVIRNNLMVNCKSAVCLTGASHRVHVVSNRILDSNWTAIDFEDFRPDTSDILVANNTLLRNDEALRIWDDHSKGKDFLKCKNIRFQNNLMLETHCPSDLIFFDYSRGKNDPTRPADLQALLKSQQWRFTHNWREIDPVRAATPFQGSWIPACLNDHLEIPIKVLSRKLEDPNFLRPPKDSPLAWSGAGGETIPAAHIASAIGQAYTLTNPLLAAWAVGRTMNQPDRSLPAYVGAVPPEGVKAWDWEKTWKAMAR